MRTTRRVSKTRTDHERGSGGGRTGLEPELPRGPGPRRPGAMERPREGDVNVRGVRTVPSAVTGRVPKRACRAGRESPGTSRRRAWKALRTEVTGLAASAEGPAGLAGLAGLRVGPHPLTGRRRDKETRTRRLPKPCRLCNCPWATTVSYAQGVLFE